jgi:L,D-peptidoglycan transpeptidase YkuD (ErfK/YbiS/YcfS/YnhG family)
MTKEITVHKDGRLFLGETQMRCALGKGGVTESKHEGDGCTPLGIFPLRKVMYRPDRLEAPRTALETNEIEDDMGWCDDPEDEHYNTLVRLPRPGRTERLFRDDHIYDIIVVLGYNDDPVFKGGGSAVFLHLARENYTPTEGCVAVSLPDMLLILGSVASGASIRIIP